YEMSQPAMKPNFLERVRLAQSFHEGIAVPQGCCQFDAARDPNRPFLWQSRHAEIAPPNAAAKGHTAHHEPRCAHPGVSEACQHLLLSTQRVRIPLKELRLVQLI